MATNAEPSSVKAKNSFVQLAAAAANLNSVSDELGKSIEELEAALKKLNPGVVVWTRMEGGRNPTFDEYWWSRDIGYAKIGGKWGIALRSCSGDYTDPEGDKDESWLFNDAPRDLRVAGVDHIPTLIEEMVAETNRMAKSIKTKATEARELAASIREVVSPSKQK